MDPQYPSSVVLLLGGYSEVAVINHFPSPKERDLQRELRTTTVCLFLSVLPPDEFSPGATYQSSHVNTKEFAGPFCKNSETSCHTQSCTLLQTCCDIDIPLRSTPGDAHPALLRAPCLGLSPGKSKIFTWVTGARQRGALGSFARLVRLSCFSASHAMLSPC